MKTKPSTSCIAGFGLVEILVGVVLFSGAAAGIVAYSKATKDFQRNSITVGQQNAYSTFQSQVTLQGLDPSKVANVMAGTIGQSGATGTVVNVVGLNGQTQMQIVRGKVAAFEVGAVRSPTNAKRDLAGSARVASLNYSVDGAGTQMARGSAMGFAIEVAGTGVTVTSAGLVAPTFNVTGDLTNATFPLNNIATLPSSNPAGTVYRYTTDATTPTGGSPIWNNSPGWTTSTFPAQVSLRAFNPDPQYSPSNTATTSYSMNLNVTYARADGRNSNLYGFTINEVSAPAAAGVVLSVNAATAVVRYTLDGSTPTNASPAYAGAFTPAQGQFGPNVTLKVAAFTSDPRLSNSAVSTFTLSATPIALSAPTIVTSNSAPLTPGTNVVVSLSDPNGTTRTEINNGTPSVASSTAAAFPLN
jgi:type II secretory pathway pseudopilin PulG